MPTGKSESVWMRVLLMVTAAGLFAAPGYAQTGGDSLRTAHNTVFLELGGNGLFYSMNAERLVAPRLGVRGGFSVMGFGNTVGFILFPATVSVLMGPAESEHYAELGGGFTPVIHSTSSQVDVLGTATLGVRYQPLGGGLFLRLALIPLLALTDGVELSSGRVGISAGFAVGYGF